MSDATSAGAAPRPTPVPIVALDVPAAAPALSLVRTLGDACRFYKIGLELFTAEGPAVVRAVRDGGNDVFLDLKFHDIPNTVRGATRSAASLGARLLTVHGSGGRAMLEAAVEGAGQGCGVLAVTVLTSMDAAGQAAAWGRSQMTVRDEVLRLADLARAAGAHGIVCSGEEAAAVRERHGDALRLLVPGIRLAGGATHDQARVVTPAAAAAAGASYLVLGRAVTGAADPRSAMAEVAAQLRH
ncbi:MAG TPA: orotidine-5'-phosphate decarboxylase [Gemmatimonadaceae bacterium]|nr:orotidine-5'-phosphate decarboxylase [Gemmatimonadaceae bacterium]